MVLLFCSGGRNHQARRSLAGQSWPPRPGARRRRHPQLGDTYYWFGEDRSQENACRIRYVACYSSTNLAQWKFRNQVIKLADPENLGRGWVLEQPKVYFNAKTKKFVMSAHIDDRRYQVASVAVFSCDTVDGIYQYLEAIS